MAAAGFNTVRLAVSWENLEPAAPTGSGTSITHRWNTAYVTALHSVVQAAARARLMVILDMHQSLVSPAFKKVVKNGHVTCEGEGFPTWLFPDAGSDPDVGRCHMLLDEKTAGVPETTIAAMADAWSFLTRSFLGMDSVIGMDLFNEPDVPKSCTAAGAKLTPDLDELGQAVRAVDPSRLLIFEDNSNYYSDGHTYLTRIPMSNSVYSFHFYPPDSKDYLGPLIQKAKTWNVPSFLGEFDAYDGARNVSPKSDDGWQQKTRSLMDVLKANAVSWALWEYVGTDSLVDPTTGAVKLDLLGVLS